MATDGNSRTTLWAFLALSLVWGSSFLFIKVGLQGLSPAQVVLGRVLLGAITLAVIMTVSRRRWPRERRVWAHMIVVGTFFCAIPFTLFAWAEQFLPSSLASIYNATTPIMTLLLTPLILPSERLGRARSLGLVVGILGVLILTAPWQLIGSPQLAATAPAQLACLGATASYGFAGLYMRRFVSGLPYDSVTLSSVQLAMASVVVVLLAPFTARGPVALDLPVVASMAGLGILGTGVAYIWYTGVLRAWGPARASTVTYLAPVVGVVLGVVVLGEAVHWYEPVGGAIVIAGIVISQGGLRRRRTLPA
ncbi:DMT family transporter [Microbacterium sp. ASV49]|uniref:DMT family transporter n=1 Tax=Microbacterium candidum TaxID=3041922 RepID=A0ABT7N2K8_9MICO|nr:DMT family transporter [Microbacterium sp. ASV49]MDL9980895.1 DMT family transporter [Microbacterium sp. ASV49]